jgi:hypothetical protein
MFHSVSTARRERLAVIVVTVLGMLALGSSAFGLEASYVGSLDQGPLAPTSLVVGQSGIAALEPYTGQLELYTAAGVQSAKVRVNSAARGLACLDDQVYLYCDRDRSCVVRVDLSDGGQEDWQTEAIEPVDVVVDGEECFVLDAGSRRILVSDRSGRITELLTLRVPDGEMSAWLSDLAWDSGREMFYVLDQTASRVLAFGRDGRSLGVFASFGNLDGQITRGGEITCDVDGWIYVTDRFQGRVVVFDHSWTFAGNIDPLSLGAPALAVPTGLAVDPAGFLYVASTEGAAIQIYHLQKDSSSVGELVTRAVSPTAGDALSAGTLRFTAGITAPATLASALVVDFRITALSDETDIVGEGTGMPISVSSIVGGSVIGTAVWEPELALDVAIEYGWQARTRAGALTGPWMTLRAFAVTAVPARFHLEQNYPNPFNPRTTIFFELRGGLPAQLAVFDLRGRQVWQRDVAEFGAGRHQAVWDGTNEAGASVSTGMYFYSLVEGDQIETKKMILMK